MRSQKGGVVTALSFLTCVCAFYATTAAVDIPLEVLALANIEQLPTITAHSPPSLIAVPFDDSFALTCEAKGNPEPEFRWTRNGQEFDPSLDPRLLPTTEMNSGTFIIPNNGNLSEFQGNYRCYASNRLGTAMTPHIHFIVPNVPKFPKEQLEPVVVEEGQPFILHCDPPSGIPPLQIYWMTINLQHIEQDERVSTGLNGDLFFSHAVEKDSRRDYCCFAAFPKIRTIVQKTAMSVVVRAKKSQSGPGAANSLIQRRPSLLTPPGGRSEQQLVKGEDLTLECIAEGIPTPQVVWLKVGEQLPAKARVEHHGKRLIIPEADQGDSGRYLCKARNELGEVTHTFTITVEEPPRWISEPQNQLHMIGSDVMIRCSASGNPTPTLTWRVNGVPLEESSAVGGTRNRKLSGDSLVLSDAGVTDSAVYQCEASNPHGSLLTNTNIMVMNLPPMILSGKGEEYWAVRGRSLMMHCRVFSSPPSSISWSRKNSADESLDDPQFTVHDNGTLEITDVDSGDSGQYTCLARNIEGSSAVDAELHVKEPTSIVVAPQDQKVLVGTTALLSCLAEYDQSFGGDFQILWEKDQEEVLNQTQDSRFLLEDGNLHIFNVTLEDQGVYSCVARTPLDGDAASALLLVLDVPDAPVDLSLLERGARSVTLTWNPGDEHSSSTTEFIVEFEESRWEPGLWRELLRVPGNQHSAALRLHGHVDYSFRVSGVNGVGRGVPSRPSERYRTPAAAPDKNPENIRIQGPLPHEMDINWEPLLPLEHNGPGLEYRVSYRRRDVDQEWTESTVKRHSFVVKDTPTFVPYEIKIQAKNHQGWGPEPKIRTGYSGEDFPSAAPEHVAVEPLNSSAVTVSWQQVDEDKLHGHLGGYRISWWRLRSLLDSKKRHGDKESLNVPGDQIRALVSGLTPFSEYSLIIMAFNGRGNGPGSHALDFKTPEGVPEKNPVFRVSEVQKHSVTLVWSPPTEPNGVLSGYLLEYQLFNDTEEAEPLQAVEAAETLQTVDISNPLTTKWTLRQLQPLSKYRFHLRSCTAVGCGPPVSQETTTTSESTPGSAPTVNPSDSALPATPSPAKTPGPKTPGSNIGLASIHSGISTQGWFIGLLSAVALLILIILITCFINRNRGGKYSVKEKEDLHPDVESQGMNDDTFCEYSDNDEKPLKGSHCSLSRDTKDSGESTVDYGDEDVQFNEDGSFIGEYAGRREKRASGEVRAAAQTPA